MIGRKLNTLIFLTVSFFGLALGFYFIRHETRELRFHLNNRISTILDSLTESAEYPLLVRDQAEIRRIVKYAVRQQDIVSCTIEDKSAAPLYQLRRETGQRLEEFSAPVMTAGTVKDGESKGVRERIGTVRLGVSPANLEARIRDVKIAIFVFILLTSLVISTIGSLMLKKILIQPITQLVQGTERIAAGDLDVRVQVDSRDEMNMLAEAFNKMAQDLKKVLVSKDELERSNSLIRTTLESTTDALLVVDREQRIVIFNRKFVDLWGIPDSILVTKDDHKALAYVLDQLMEPEAFLRKVEELYRLPDAQSFDVLCMKDGRTLERYSAPQRLGNVIIGRVWSFRDVTERRRMEKEREELQSRVFQSDKLAAIGQLAGGVAHEINNPLGVILGFAQSLTRRIREGDPLAAPLQSIEREANRCKNLVQELLTFSRVGKTEKELCDLNHVVQSALSLVEAQTKVRSIELIKQLDEEAGEAMINPTQIEQVVINLCNNAIDAMPKGGTLTVRSRRVRMDREELLEIAVQDTGEGIAEEIRPRIFDPFFTTKEVGKGTGLGLALVYEIAQKHAGTVRVDSVIGQGSCFTILMPRETVQL